MQASARPGLGHGWGPAALWAESCSRQRCRQWTPGGSRPSVSGFGAAGRVGEGAGAPGAPLTCRTGPLASAPRPGPSWRGAGEAGRDTPGAERPALCPALVSGEGWLFHLLTPCPDQLLRSAWKLARGVEET